MINKENNKKLITFSTRSMDMIEAIMEETGFNTTTQVVTRGIEELYKNTFKYGKDPLNGIGGGSNDPDAIQKVAERKVAMKAAEEKAQSDLKLAPKIAICVDQLKGEVRDGVCYYKNYFLDGSSQDENCPIVSIGQHSIDNQFIPNKEAVIKNNPNLFK